MGQAKRERSHQAPLGLQFWTKSPRRMCIVARPEGMGASCPKAASDRRALRLPKAVSAKAVPCLPARDDAAPTPARLSLAARLSLTSPASRSLPLARTARTIRIRPRVCPRRPIFTGRRAHLPLTSPAELFTGRLRFDLTDLGPNLGASALGLTACSAPIDLWRRESEALWRNWPADALSAQVALRQPAGRPASRMQPRRTSLSPSLPCTERSYRAPPVADYHLCRSTPPPLAAHAHPGRSRCVHCPTLCFDHD
jgi:hypothetical protein